MFLINSLFIALVFNAWQADSTVISYELSYDQEITAILGKVVQPINMISQPN